MKLIHRNQIWYLEGEPVWIDDPAPDEKVLVGPRGRMITIHINVDFWLFETYEWQIRRLTKFWRRHR